MRQSGRLVGVVLVAGLLVAACGGSGSDDAAAPADSSVPENVKSTDDEDAGNGSSPAAATSSDALVVDDSVNQEALDSLAADFASLDEDQQFAQVNELSWQLERDLYEFSGVTEALGSAETADASIAETGQWYADMAATLQADIEAAPLEPEGFRRPASAPAGAPSLGMGLFGGMVVSLLGAEAVVARMSDGKNGTAELGKGVTVAFTDAKVELNAETTSTDSHGVTTMLKTRNVATPCPAADGTFSASASVDTSSTVSNGATGKRATVEVEVRGTVDDNAGLVGYDTTSRSQYSDFTAHKGGFLDLTIALPHGGPSSATINRSGGEVTSSIVEEAVGLNRLMMMMVGYSLVDAAKKAWESGRCVELVPTVSAGPKGLTPSASVTITAAPRSKVDGGPVGGTVTAILSGGEAAVTPSSTPVPADAEFTYDAPGEPDKTGQVSLEARSKRGVAKATIDFDTVNAYSYQIVGGLDDFQTDTEVCDVRLPFMLSGGGIDVQFSGGLTGTYTYTGVYSAAGGGEYAITLPGGPGQPGTMDGGGEGTVHGGAVGSGTEHYTLTPITC